MKIVLVLAAVSAVVTGKQTLCGYEQTATGHGYIINNNDYNMNLSSGSQCTYVDSISSKGVQWSTTWQWTQTSEDDVVSYANSGLDLSNSDKKLLSDIHSIPTSVTWSYENSQNIVADVSYDLFTAKNRGHTTDSGDFELMIWLAKYGDIQPLGKKVKTVSVGGKSWDLWSDKGDSPTSMITYSFVAQGTTNKWSGDIKHFFDYLAQHQGFPASSQHLLTVQFGTEPKSGGQSTLKVADWTASLH